MIPDYGMDGDMRFAHERFAVRILLVSITLLMGVPYIFVRSAFLIVLQATWFTLNGIYLLCRSLVFSTIQMFLNIYWFCKRVIKENLN